jgi:integrase/recombinase XerD
MIAVSPSTARSIPIRGAYMRVLDWLFPPVKSGASPLLTTSVTEMTFEDAVRMFETDFLPTIKPKAATRYRVSVKALIRSFAGVPISEITTSNLTQFVSVRRQDGVQGATIRRDLACLSSILQQARLKGWVRENPLMDLDLCNLDESPPRTRHLSGEEETALIAHAADYLKLPIIFAIETGLRLEEQVTLEWRDVNLERREITLTRTKTNSPRTVPLTDRAADVLRQQRRHWTSPYVFWKADGSRYSRFTRGLAGAAKRAGLAHVRWNDLRRTCGCRLIEQGMDIYKVSSLLGHRSVAVTERTYAFLRPEKLNGTVGVGSA